MKKSFFSLLFLCCAVMLTAQPSNNASFKVPEFFLVKTLKATPVKNQAMTGTCWCFSATSLIESEAIRKESKEIELSEMFTVRNIYIEKAKNYILRIGKAQFSEGGLGHDMIRATSLYGAVPLDAYTGLVNGRTSYNHSGLFELLQHYLDSILKKQPIVADWMNGYVKILDDSLGAAPASFMYNGKSYTPVSFAKDVLKFNADDFVSLTSFTHQPYYSHFVLQVPDNFANGYFYNVPLNEMTGIVKNAIDKGYTVAWDADVSNRGFMQGAGVALYLSDTVKYTKDMITPDLDEAGWDAGLRQRLYENLTTQDDHLMHITGTEKSKNGKTFFIVKNSWGKIGPFNGYINVSESYFAVNTISIVVPKAALSKELLAQLKIQ